MIMTKEPIQSKNLSLAKRLNYAIDSLGWGGKSLIAEKCDVSRQAVSIWCKKGCIEKSHLLLVAKITGFNLNWIITGEGDPHAPDEEQGSKDKVRVQLDEILAACDLAMRHSGRYFTDAEKLEIYLEGIEFAGRKQLPGDLVKHYLEVLIKKSQK